ncbi:hypothetical protein AB0469_14395 [Streptomyces sp. NPDC093801]|uniref:lipase/acyltransferase domain-containing protein n=1 Tax=Streptomyces sp. NPDC093801 TaxID=3155203 RepID=UPI0034506987
MPDRQHLVMVVPGIGGSLLAERGEPERPVWSAATRDLRLLRRPEPLSVEVNPRLVPVGLVPTRKAMPFWTPVHGYNGLLARLGALPGAVLDDGTPAGRTTAATVVGFGYDFRLGVRDAAERFGAAVDERLTALWPDRGAHDKRLIIVAHSLGGLVARYWLAGAKENWERCRALLTLGTPHAGAPKALDVLVNGVPLLGGHILRERLGPVLGTWTSMADLLPAYAAVRAEGPAARTTGPVSAVQDPGPQWLWPEALPVPGLAGPAAQGRLLHQKIADGWRTIPRDGPQVLARIGYGHHTVRSASWDGRRLRASRKAPDNVDFGAWREDLGDGTVPAFSGQPAEHRGQYETGLLVAERHGTIADLAGTADWVQGLEERPRQLPIRGEERPVVLGLDIEELQLTGTAVPLAASVTGADPDLRDVPVWATVTPAGEPGRRLQEVPLDLDGEGRAFTGELASLPPGLYDVRVTAEGVPGGGDLAGLATVEVLDDADLD